MNLRSTEALRLRTEVERCEIVFKKAQHEYKRALSVAMDTAFSSDGATGLRLAARHYAASLAEYNLAVRKWAEYLLRS